ncbi:MULTISPECIES: hypothetical protein [Kitasatospora]|uniref:Uncharacterized protein n=1 Tax=Kitasatospora setae (strain ATCC 33774 / DSM 43861 / JCM 3304 / KCC A-0304 / NBRC 14216 / KM-6054) TaxID=452652 RepID=E4N982_KITSK|nr:MULTISPECIES: hypothetical protein [Kitasatospora]BAJ27763.1 hypothetical protein KSE_19390 [Kitasatospora setae KM-6054]
MDAEITLLAGTAGTTIATLLATETWNSVRAGVLALWRRVRPDHEAGLAAQLDASRRDVLEAGAAGDEQTAAEVAAEWRGRVRRLLEAHPELVADLRALLAELAPDTPAAAPAVVQRAEAAGSSRVYQAGRDLHIGRP